MQPIKNEPGYVRDPRTGAIINNNISDYKLILAQRKHKEEVEVLRSEIDDLRELFHKAIGNK